MLLHRVYNILSAVSKNFVSVPILYVLIKD